MFTNKKSLLALSVASAVALSGCGSDDDNNVPVPPVQPPVTVIVPPEAPLELDLVVNANVVDAATGDVVPATLSFLTNGEAASNIVDLDGNSLTMSEAADGSLAFTKKEDSTISEVTVNVVADGYISKSFIVDLTTEDSDQKVIPVSLSLTAVDADGIADASETVGIEGGTTSSAIVVEAKGSGASGSATVPAGVQLFDKDGSAVSGDVTLNVTAADSKSSAAGQIVPEGLNSADATVAEKPVGAVNVLMTNSNGEKVKSFSNPISVTMAIPADTMLNGEAIKTGDMLNLKSHNEDTGLWDNESEKVTVGALDAATNTYTGAFETDHLTFFASTVTVNDLCTDGLSLSISGDAVPATGLYASIASSDASASAYLRSGSTSNVLLSSNQSKRFGISAAATARVKVFDANGESWYDSGAQNEVSVCGSVPVTLANPSTVLNEDFTVTASCANDADQSIDMSNAIVRYSLQNKRSSVAIASGNGSFLLPNLLEGQTYNVTVNARVELAAGVTTQSSTITADGTAESLALSVACDETTGSTGGN